MIFNHTSHRVLIVFFLVLMFFLIVQTSSFAAKKDKKQDYVMTEIELQSELMSYADRFASIISQAFEDFETLNPQPQARQIILSDLVYSLSSMYTIAAEPNPQVGLLDMVTVTTLGRIIYEENMRKKYGNTTIVMGDGFRQLEKDIWQIAAKVLSTEQQVELRELILLWRKNNPDKVVYNYLRFSDFAAQRRDSTLVKKVHSGGLFKTVQEVTQQVEETRMLAERGIFLGTRLPLLTGNFAEVWMTQLLVSPEIEKILSNVDRFSAVSERLAAVAEQLPEQISQERDTTVQQVMKEVSRLRYLTINQVMKEVTKWSDVTIGKVMEQVAVERNAAIDQLMNRLVGEQKNALEELLTEEERVKGLVSELRLTLAEGDNLLQSATALTKQINLDLSKPAEKPPVDSKPFDIKDYQATVAEVSNTVEKLTALVQTTNQLVGSVGLEELLPELVKAIDSVGRESEELVDHTVRQVILLIVISMVAYVIARLIYAYIHKRWIELKA